jgi:putative membrane protein
MNVIAQVLAVLVGLTLIAVGVLEAFFYRNQRFHSLFLIEPKDTSAVRLWTMNVGFYNIVFGVAILCGVLFLNLGDLAAGRAIVYLVCVSHVVLGIMLAVVEPRLWRSAVGQASLPLVVILVDLLF